MIVFITSDLMMASNANAHAQQQGVKISQVSTAERGLEMVQEHRPQPVSYTHLTLPTILLV